MRPAEARRGSVAVVVALVLLVLAGFAALVVDLGYARLVQAQLQAAADAASLGGVEELDLTDDGLTEARSVAVGVAALNSAHGETVVLDPNDGNASEGDVTLGVWDRSAQTFTASMDAAEVNAVQVIARRDDLTPLLSRVAWGRDHLGAAARSIAVIRGELGAGEVPYYLPFGLPMCLWDENDPDEIMDMTFVLSPAGEDNTGWANLGGHPSTSWILDHIAAVLPCMHEWYETGEVDVACVEGSIDNTATLDNGLATSALRGITDAVEAGVAWDSSVWGVLPEQQECSGVDEELYGHMFAGPIPVFDGGGSYCSEGGGAWTGSAPLDGFVWAAIYDVCDKGSAANKNVYLRVDLSSRFDIGTWYGGGDYGIYSSGPGVVVR